MAMAEPDAYEPPQDLLSHQGTPLILALNDDCLERVLKKLALQDQVRFARTCLRFRTIYKMATARLHKSVNSDELERCTTWEVRDFFKLSGAHVQGIKIRHMEESLAELVGEECSNLKTLHFGFCRHMPSFMKPIIEKAYHLEVLKMCSTNILDEDISVLQSLTNLKVLELSESLITGCTLNVLPTSIEVLTLNCLILDVGYLSKTCQRLTKLRSLDLRRLESYKDVFKTLVMENSCPSLEVLRFTMNLSRHYEYVAQLPSLKELVICSDLVDSYGNDLLSPHARQSYNGIWSEVLDGLVKYKNQKLEHLTIGRRLTKEQLMQVGKLSALRVLCLSWVDFDCTPIANLKLLEKMALNDSLVSDSMVLTLFHACPKLHCLELNASCLNAKFIQGIADRVRQELTNSNMQRKLPIEVGFFTIDLEIRKFISNRRPKISLN
ncbi:uncharacterized protein LOC108029873 isoform X2 [Drosophila biarmipes]|uniref:uncharacterized protein LOC108029873 isoform X2 n=1 Tax=Drosophila biarmipes TaxID=125945 RepID=UPI0021CC5923|nr:uncharacterized protein LOC108029873 isoform X2 [Drosophila biarmipes]